MSDIRGKVRKKLTEHFTKYDGGNKKYDPLDDTHRIMCPHCLILSKDDQSRENAFIGVINGEKQDVFAVECSTHPNKSVWVNTRTNYNNKIPLFKARSSGNMRLFKSLYAEKKDENVDQNTEDEPQQTISTAEQKGVSVSIPNFMVSPPPISNIIPPLNAHQMKGLEEAAPPYIIANQQFLRENLLPDIVKHVTTDEKICGYMAQKIAHELREKHLCTQTNGMTGEEQGPNYKELYDDLRREYKEKEEELTKDFNLKMEKLQQDHHDRLIQENEEMETLKRKLRELRDHYDEGSDRVKKKRKLDTFIGENAAFLLEGYSNDKTKRLRKNLFNKENEYLFGKVEKPMEAFVNILSENVPMETEEES